MSKSLRRQEGEGEGEGVGEGEGEAGRMDVDEDWMAEGREGGMRWDVEGNGERRGVLSLDAEGEKDGSDANG